MAILISESKPLNPPALIQLLSEFQVKYILAGSYAVACHGVAVVARDLDIVPRLSAANLLRLSALLGLLEAKPVHHPGWAAGLSVEQCDAWQPEPPTEQQLDHLLATEYGLLDVVPRLCGTYEGLRRNSIRLELDGCTVRVAGLTSLERKMVRAGRKKDDSRLQEIRRLSRHKKTPGGG